MHPTIQPPCRVQDRGVAERKRDLLTFAEYAHKGRNSAGAPPGNSEKFGIAAAKAAVKKELR
jgi:hypothetical protein